MSAREEILGRVRHAGEADACGGNGAVPAPAPHVSTWEQRAARFAARARTASATVVRVTAAEDVERAVAEYLHERNLPPVVRMTAEPPGLPPGRIGPLQFRTGPIGSDGETVVSGCFAAVAEEGVIVMVSGPGHAAESVMLAATHVAVVRAAQMVDSLEALWQRVRAADLPPRTLNLILGPSRTADLGLPIRLGAHGPLRVHVVLIDPPAA